MTARVKYPVIPELHQKLWQYHTIILIIQVLQQSYPMARFTTNNPSANLSLGKMVAVSQTTLSDAFSQMKSFVF